MADDAGRLNQVFAETSFLYGSNAAFIEGLHDKWAADPSSVSAEWRGFFDQLRDTAATVQADLKVAIAQKALIRERAGNHGAPAAGPGWRWGARRGRDGTPWTARRQPFLHDARVR